ATRPRRLRAVHARTRRRGSAPRDAGLRRIELDLHLGARRRADRRAARSQRSRGRRTRTGDRTVTAPDAATAPRNVFLHDVPLDDARARFDAALLEVGVDARGSATETLALADALGGVA